MRTGGTAEERPPRIALTPGEAAQAIGCSRDFVDEHIAPELRWVRRGRLKFVAIVELQDWFRRNAVLALGVERKSAGPHSRELLQRTRKCAVRARQGASVSLISDGSNRRPLLTILGSRHRSQPTATVSY